MKTIKDLLEELSKPKWFETSESSEDHAFWPENTKANWLKIRSGDFPGLDVAEWMLKNPYADAK